MSEISQSTLQLITNYFHNIAAGQQKSEIVRQILAEQVLFEPYTAFKRIDQQRQGHLELEGLTEFLQDNQINVQDPKEIQYLISLMDRDRDGMVSYTDFSSFILPNINEHLRQLANMRENYILEQNMLLPYEVEWSLARVFNQELFNFRSQHQMRNQINNQRDWDISSTFQLINRGKNITKNSFGNFMQDYGLLLSDDEINNFFFAAAKHNGAVINFGEFSILFQTSPPQPLNHVASKQTLKKNDIQTFQTPEKKQITNQSSNFKSTQSTTYKSHTKQTFNTQQTEDDHYAMLQIFYDQIKNQKDLSNLQRKLAFKFDFSPLPLFAVIDKCARGFVNKQQFTVGLEALGVYANKKQIQLFFAIYADELNKLTYAGFQNAVLPKCAKYSRLVKARSQRLISDKLTKETISIFQQLFLAIFDHEEYIENSKQYLNINLNFDCDKNFQLLDESNQGYITLESIQQEFTKFNFNVSTEDIFNLIRIYDKDQDGVISYEEFTDGLKPHTI